MAARTCGFDSNQDEDDHPSYDEMLADGAAKLKGYLSKASEKCAEQFMANVAGVEK